MRVVTPPVGGVHALSPCSSWSLGWGVGQARREGKSRRAVSLVLEVSQKAEFGHQDRRTKQPEQHHAQRTQAGAQPLPSLPEVDREARQRSRHRPQDQPQKPGGFHGCILDDMSRQGNRSFADRDVENVGYSGAVAVPGDAEADLSQACRIGDCAAAVAARVS